MKKSILLFAIIASVFVACNPQKDVDYINQDVYGIWRLQLIIHIPTKQL